MQKVTIRSFVLSYAQLQLANTMIRRAGIIGRLKHKDHDLLHAKILAALIRARQMIIPTIHLTEVECRLMRRYNTDYCAAMGGPQGIKDFMTLQEDLRNYRRANQLHKIFSTL